MTKEQKEKIEKMIASASLEELQEAKEELFYCPDDNGVWLMICREISNREFKTHREKMNREFQKAREEHAKWYENQVKEMEYQFSIGIPSLFQW